MEELSANLEQFLLLSRGMQPQSSRRDADHAASSNGMSQKPCTSNEAASVFVTKLVSRAKSGPIINAQDARAIYKKKRMRSPHDAKRLASQYGITAKAVRDIWSHRTWKKATVCFWTLDETRHFIDKGFCERCFSAVTTSSGHACAKCKRTLLGIARANADIRPSPLLPICSEYDKVEQQVFVPTEPRTLHHRMDHVWQRKNAQLGGLMDEALSIL